MIAFIKDWVFGIVALVLFIILVEMLLPSGRMKRYANLVTGFILIIAIINPFIGLLGSKVNLMDSISESGGFLDRAVIKKEGSMLKEEQMRQIVEVYRKKIIERLEQTALDTEGVTGAEADVIINEDYRSDRFGEIKRAYLKIETDGGKDKVKPIARVEKVRVGNGARTVQNGEGSEPGAVRRLEDRIANLYGVDRNNIVISGLKE